MKFILKANGISINEQDKQALWIHLALTGSLLTASPAEGVVLPLIICLLALDWRHQIGPAFPTWSLPPYCYSQNENELIMSPFLSPLPLLLWKISLLLCGTFPSREKFGKSAESLCPLSSFWKVTILQNWKAFVQIENSALLGLLSTNIDVLLEFFHFFQLISFFLSLPIQPRTVLFYFDSHHLFLLSLLLFPFAPAFPLTDHIIFSLFQLLSFFQQFYFI